MKKSIFLLLGCSVSLLSCSTEDSTTAIPAAQSDSQTTTFSTNSVTTFGDRFLRFNWARRSKYCESGLGICTMKDYDEAQEEKAQREKELRDLEQKDYGIYSSNSIEVPIDPNDDLEKGVIDVYYDSNQLLATGQLQLDIKLAHPPTSAPIPLKVEETLSVTIGGRVFSLPAGDYNYNPSLGSHGGYTITISN